MFNFYAQDLTRKVMGKKRHGSHSVVYVARGGISSEVVHYHEEAHRSLNSATTVGKYLSALAFVASQQQERLVRLSPSGESYDERGVPPVGAGAIGDLIF